MIGNSADLDSCSPHDLRHSIVPSVCCLSVVGRLHYSSRMFLGCDDFAATSYHLHLKLDSHRNFPLAVHEGSKNATFVKKLTGKHKDLELKIIKVNLLFFKANLCA
jgi:hypothetical protein